MIDLCSDFGQLYRTLAQDGVMTAEAEAAAKSSARKLRSEKYDEVQIANVDFLRKVREKTEGGKFVR